MARTLSDWLASESDSEADAPPTATVAAPALDASRTPPTHTQTPTTPEAHPGSFGPLPSDRKQELREHMAKLLGPETVVAAERAARESVSSQSTAAASPKMSPTTSQPAAMAVATAEHHHNTSVHNGAPLLEYRRVEVMVTDRGTQTVSTTGTQTDAEPSAAVCRVVEPPGAYVARTADSVLDHRMGPNYWSFSRVGIDGRPYRQMLEEVEGPRHTLPDARPLRQQLESIQHSIDMLIARYQLPPPPVM